LEIDPVYLGTEEISFEEGGLDEEAMRYYRVDPKRYKGLFGCAVLSRYPVKSADVVPLRHQGYDWYWGERPKISFLEQARRFGAKKVFLSELHRELKVGGRILMRVEKPEARSFYEIECVKNNWSARELERQKGSLLFERLALSKDKKGLLRLARKGQELASYEDMIKDPYVLEFTGLSPQSKLYENKLEQALIDNLSKFLLELGKGFTFVARQKRISLDGDHFYIDLVFYNTMLKCYVVIDLKIGKLVHQDIGQMQMYVNYYDREVRQSDDNPTVGLVLCEDKKDAVVRYTLSKDNKQIFASRYKLYLPTEEELVRELKRERLLLGMDNLNK